MLLTSLLLLTFSVANRKNTRGLLRKCLLSDKQAGFQRKPAQNIKNCVHVGGRGCV